MLYRAAKRLFDLLSSLLALIVLSPVFLVVCIGIKASSRGPVFYRSERIGRNGKPFTMMKFRSMHLKEEGAKESQYLVNGSRIFPFGRFLRKSKIDELPQLLNVLIADMSVVGPRPYPKKAVDKWYTGEYAAILSAKPGLSCFDSLYDYAHGELFVKDEGEYARDVLPVRTELARMYIDRQGIGTDIVIILRTVKMIWDIVVRKKTKFPFIPIEQEAAERVRAKKEGPQGAR